MLTVIYVSAIPCIDSPSCQIRPFCSGSRSNWALWSAGPNAVHAQSRGPDRVLFLMGCVTRCQSARFNAVCSANHLQNCQPDAAEVPVQTHLGMIPVDSHLNFFRWRTWLAIVVTHLPVPVGD